jgi:predicted enzyme related to lactoylglutathione lyase
VCRATFERSNMLERDGYVPGVPCWVDTTHPDPEAAVASYTGLFGWAFEDMMPPGSPSRYFIARLRGGDVAAIGSQPEDAPAAAAWNTYVWVQSADEVAAKVLDAGRAAVFADAEGATFCGWQAKEHKGADRQPARLAELRRPEYARPRKCQVVLRLDVRLGHARPPWRHDVAVASYGDFLEQRSPGIGTRAPAALEPRPP